MIICGILFGFFFGLKLFNFITFTIVAEILKSLEMQINSTLSQDLFRIMVSEIQKSRGIAVDESAINAVHVNFQ